MKHFVIWSGESLGCLAIIGIALLFVIISSMLPMLIVVAIIAGLGYLLVRACTDIPGNRARWVAAFAVAYLVIGSFTAVVAHEDIVKSRTRGLWQFSSTDTFGVFVDQAKIVLLWPYILIRDQFREKT
jgi:Ni/Fe-hydrogenase subunit HybB-like protein